MSKYTKSDSEVLFMDSPDRVNYEVDLMKHDVDKAVELSWGFEGIRDFRSIKSRFKNWKTMHLAIITLLTFILTIVLIVVLIIYIYVYLRKVEWKRQLLHKVSISVFFLFLVLVILYYIFGKLMAEMMMLVLVTKEAEKN